MTATAIQLGGRCLPVSNDLLWAPLLTIRRPAPRAYPTIRDNYIHVQDAPDSRACHMIWGQLGPNSNETFQIIIAVELLQASTLRWLG